VGTHRLDLADPTLREWDAVVVGVDPERGIVLDRSAFYPGGGGQPPDEGVLLWGGVRTRIAGVAKDLKIWVPVPSDGAYVATIQIIGQRGQVLAEESANQQAGRNDIPRVATLAGFELRLTDVGQNAQALGHVTARVDRNDWNASRNSAFDGRPKRVGVRDRDHQTVRVRGHRGVDQLRHGHHVEPPRRLVLDADAHVFGGLVNAIFDDGPERQYAGL
jgi:hypothetical protein